MKLKKRVLFPMLAIILTQEIVFVGVIIQAGTFKDLKEGPETNLVNTVNAKSAGLEERLIGMAKTSEYVSSVQNVVTHIEQRENKSVSRLIMDEDIREEIVQSCTYFALSNLRNSASTGCFLFIVDGKNSSLKNGVYLRDLNPNVNSNLNLDILAEIGSADLFRTMNLTLDTYWASKLEVSKTDDFYYQPIEAAKKYPELSDTELGYWSKPFRRVSNDIEVITYSQPLRDSDGKVYAIAGIEVSCNYLSNLYQNSDISVDDNGSFFLATESDKDTVNPLLFTGSYYKAKYADKDLFKLVDQKGSKMSQVNVDDESTEDLAYMLPLRLYDNNTPFSEQQWYMGAIVNENRMYDDSSTLIKSMLLAFFVSIIISLLGTMVITSIVVNPIKKFMAQIRNTKNNKVHLGKTNINEIDELSREIERLNADILDISSKVSRIIDITDMPLGVYEYSQNKDNVFCTQKLIDILELDGKEFDGYYMPREVFEQEMDKRRLSFLDEKRKENVYSFTCKDGSTRWVNIRMAGESASQLCIAVDVTNDIKKQAKIEHDRDYDVLTNLLNRRAFESRVNHMLDHGDCREAVFSIWDLDNLKYVNDTYGHDMGDKYICHLAEFLAVLDSYGCYVARMSGDEFMIFYYNMYKTVEEKCHDIERIHAEFLQSKMLLPDGTDMSVSASGGISVYPQDTSVYKELTRYADFAMYEVKRHSKGSIKRFDRDSYMENFILVHGVGELNRILDEESVRYMFQPIFDVKTNEIFAYEALMRPISEILCNPGDLIRVASAQSKLDRIEKITWYHSLQAFSKAENIDKKAKLFVNSIPNQCLTSVQMDYLEKNYTSTLSKVVMEITEETKIDIKIEKTKAQWCKALGMETALDDYGAGYSNNDVLVSKDLDYVKIDMLIVRDIDSKPARQRLVQGIIEYCHGNNIMVIAEGVETKEEYDEMIRLGVDYVQGFYLGKPQYIS